MPKRQINRGRNNGKNGRPPADAALKARAIELVEGQGMTCEEAGELVGLGGNTVRRAVKAKEAAANVEAIEVSPAPVLELPPLLPPDLPSDVSAAIVSIADVDKARAVRRLVQGMGGIWDGAAVESLAETWGCALADVQALMIEASIQAGRCILPPELAREEAIATLRGVRTRAKNAADFKSETLAALELLKVQLAQSEAADVLTKAQFVALARQLIDAVTPFPGAREAAIRVLVPG